MRKWIKALISILIVLILACGGLVYWAYSIGRDVWQNPLSAFQNDVDKAENDTIQVGDVEMVRDEGIVNILFLGIDSNESREERQKGYRSDMIMLCSVDTENDKVSMLSVPRDTYATVYHIDTQTGAIESETQNKINAAYSFGGGPNHYGAENAMRCVSELLSCDGRLNVPINYYVSIDMDGIPKVADAVGGVEVTLTEDFAGIGSEGETVTLRGEDADNFVRNRHDFAGGDNTRAKHQQQFMMGIAKKVKEMGAISAAPKLYDEMLSYAKTNLQMDQILALAGVLDRIDLDDITFNTTTGTGDTLSNGTWILRPDMDDMYVKVRDLLYKTKEAGSIDILA